MYAFTKDPANNNKKLPKELRNGKYTVTDAGKTDRCAWTEEGLEKYIEIKNKIKEARADEKYIKVEKECLASIRKAKGFMCATHEEEQRRKKVSLWNIVHLPNDPYAHTLVALAL